MPAIFERAVQGVTKAAEKKFVPNPTKGSRNVLDVIHA